MSRLNLLTPLFRHPLGLSIGRVKNLLVPTSVCIWFNFRFNSHYLFQMCQIQPLVVSHFHLPTLSRSIHILRCFEIFSSPLL